MSQKTPYHKSPLPCTRDSPWCSPAAVKPPGCTATSYCQTLCSHATSMPKWGAKADINAHHLRDVIHKSHSTKWDTELKTLKFNDNSPNVELTNLFLAILSYTALEQRHLLYFPKKSFETRRETKIHDSHIQTFKSCFIIKWNPAKSLYQIHQIFSHFSGRMNAATLLFKKIK